MTKLQILFCDAICSHKPRQIDIEWVVFANIHKRNFFRPLDDERRRTPENRGKDQHGITDEHPSRGQGQRFAERDEHPDQREHETRETCSLQFLARNKPMCADRHHEG